MNIVFHSVPWKLNIRCDHRKSTACTHVGIPLATDKPAPVMMTAGRPESSTDAMRLKACSTLDRRSPERPAFLFLRRLFLIITMYRYIFLIANRVTHCAPQRLVNLILYKPSKNGHLHAASCITGKRLFLSHPMAYNLSLQKYILPPAILKLID